MNITSPDGISYSIGDQLGATETYKLYQCSLGKKNAYILKIATAIQYNGLLDREALFLRSMMEKAIDLEEEYAKIKEGPQILNYQLFFPNLLDSFTIPEQDNRRANILDLSQICGELHELAPASHIVFREKVRIDPRTSAWILGKLLKLLVFTHGQNIGIGDIDIDNILINREQHYVCVFDWTNAKIFDATVPPETAMIEISNVAREVAKLLGADPLSGELMPDKQLSDKRYENFIKHLLSYAESDAKKVHTEFYQLIRALWPRKFHPFTVYQNS